MRQGVVHQNIGRTSLDRAIEHGWIEQATEAIHGCALGRVGLNNLRFSSRAKPVGQNLGHRLRNLVSPGSLNRNHGHDDISVAGSLAHFFDQRIIHHVQSDPKRRVLISSLCCRIVRVVVEVSQLVPNDGIGQLVSACAATAEGGRFCFRAINDHHARIRASVHREARVHEAAFR